MQTLADLSRAQAELIARAARFTVGVDARRQYSVSGVAFDERHVLTLDHAVERDEDMHLILPDGSTVGARVRGRDSRSNLVLLSSDAALPAAAALAASPPRIGDIVLALGRPSGAVEAVSGIVSAAGGPLRFRGGGSVESYLETDALRVQGFSGGPVVDTAGAVLGITMNSARETRSFAIGAAHAWKVAAALREGGSIRRGYLGIRSQPVRLGEAVQGELGREQTSGLLVVGTEEGGPAESAGFLVGDIVVGFASRAAREHEDLVDALGPEVVGKTVAVEIVRGGKVVRVDVKPSAAP